MEVTSRRIYIARTSMMWPTSLPRVPSQGHKKYYGALFSDLAKWAASNEPSSNIKVKAKRHQWYRRVISWWKSIHGKTGTATIMMSHIHVLDESFIAWKVTDVLRLVTHLHEFIHESAHSYYFLSRTVRYTAQAENPFNIMILGSESTWLIILQKGTGWKGISCYHTNSAQHKF